MRLRRTANFSSLPRVWSSSKNASRLSALRENWWVRKYYLRWGRQLRGFQVRNMMGLIGNIAEVDSLRCQLMMDPYIKIFRWVLVTLNLSSYLFFSTLLRNEDERDSIEISYNSAGVLAHLASDGDESWSGIQGTTRQTVMTNIIEVTVDEGDRESNVISLLVYILVEAGYETVHQLPFLPSDSPSHSQVQCLRESALGCVGSSQSDYYWWMQILCLCCGWRRRRSSEGASHPRMRQRRYEKISQSRADQHSDMVRYWTRRLSRSDKLQERNSIGLMAESTHGDWMRRESIE